MSIHTEQYTTTTEDVEPEWWPPVWTLFDEHEQASPRVLVAEPRAELRLQIGHALRQAGMDADFASSSEEAKAMVKRERYDVAVLNPDMDSSGSVSLCRALSRGSGGGSTPVVTLSDRNSSVGQIRSMLNGAQACLVRPLSSDHFVGTVWRMARGD